MWKCLFSLVMLAWSGEAAAQSRLADSTIVIERALTLSAVRPLTFARSSPNGGALHSAGFEEAVIQVTGDPGRLYRVRLPETIATSTPGTIIDGFTVWSDSSGDISRSLSGRIDATGRDRLRIGGSLRHSNGIILTDVTAAIPVSVDYE